MQSITITVLAVAFILVAYVGPVAAFAAAVYVAYSLWGTSIGLAITAFFASLIVMMIVLRFAKRLVRGLMNKVDLGEEDEAGA